MASVLAGLVPPTLMLALTYRFAQREVTQTLEHYTEVLQDRASEIFASAEGTLSELAQHIDHQCTDTSFRALRSAVYRSLYFREAGLIYDDAVQCTSEHMFTPPVAITNADHLQLPEHGLHIAMPQKTLEGEVSIILLYRISDGIGVNLLLNPRQLTEPLRGIVDGDHFRLTVMRTDGGVLAELGSEGDDEERLASSSIVGGYPVMVKVSGSRNWLMREWRRNVPTFLGLGLALSLPIFLMLKRFERRERTMDVQISDALEAGELRVYYQPIHSADGSRCVGAEALLRWQHPQRGMILPSVFVPLTEETGFIVPITKWLMHTAFAEIAPLLAEHPDFYLSINLSPRHFADPELPELIKEVFKPPFVPGQLVFELTERELVDGSTQTTRDVIESMRKGGARIALDDFGTGYSSFQYLSQFSFDLLKIDKSFIDAIGTESVTAGLVGDMLSMSRRLGLITIAEGVETAEQLIYLRAHGVDYVQGWLFSEALPIDRLRAYVRTHGTQPVQSRSSLV